MSITKLSEITITKMEKLKKDYGEYFTPQEVSELLFKLAIGNKKEVNNNYFFLSSL